MRWSIFPEIKGRFPAKLFVEMCGTFGDVQGAYRTEGSVTEQQILLPMVKI